MTYTPPAHTPYQWKNKPSTDTPLDEAHLEAAEQDLEDYTKAGLVDLAGYTDAAVAAAQAAAIAASAQGLTPTAVKTGTYAAAAGDFVPVDISGGSFTVTLPNAPADKTRIGVKVIKVDGSHANAATVARAGSDVFNVAGGSTSLTLSALFQGVLLQYKASSGIWYVSTADTPIGQPNGAGSLDSTGRQPIAQSPLSVVTDGSTRPQGTVWSFATTQAANMRIQESEQDFTDGGVTATDCGFYFGYNYDALGHPLVAGEPSLFMTVESNYRNGGDNFMEWNLHHHTAAGADYEPFNLSISRSTKATRLGIITGLLDVAPDGVAGTPVAQFQQMGVIAQAFNTGQIELGSDTSLPTIHFGTGTATIVFTSSQGFTLNKAVAAVGTSGSYLRANASSAAANNANGVILGYDGVAGADAPAISFGATNGDASIARTAANTLKTSSTFDAATLRATASTPGPTSGTGMEMIWDGASGTLFTYDRSASAYKPTIVSGSSVTVRYQASGSSGFKVDGSGISFYNHATAGQATISGSRGSNAALASLLTALAATGLIVDSSTA